MADVASRSIIIGYGNPLRGDDGVGLYLTRVIEGLHWPGVETRAVHQLTPDLAAEIALAERAVFVDARISQVAEGVRFEPIQDRGSATALTHVCNPETLIGLAAALYGRRPECWLVSVPGECFDPSDELSPSVLEHIQNAVKTVQSLVFPPAKGGTSGVIDA
jgi:hydrogenase maturation protease